MSRATRVIVVTLGLAAAGIIVGAACGVAIVAGVLFFRGGLAGLVSADNAGVLLAAAEFGSVVGAIGAPALAWGLLRYVPLGRAILWTALGTLTGALVGELISPFSPFVRGIPAMILGGLIGFAVAGVVLRIRARRPGEPIR